MDFGLWPEKVGRVSAGWVSQGHEARGSFFWSADRACLCWDSTAETTSVGVAAPPLYELTTACMALAGPMSGQALHDQQDVFSGIPLRDCPVSHDEEVRLAFSKEGWGEAAPREAFIMRALGTSTPVRTGTSELRRGGAVRGRVSIAS
eukprot:scaffold588069_cov43-Prasinocladus_malaysianus.AAC.1